MECGGRAQRRRRFPPARSAPLSKEPHEIRYDTQSATPQAKAPSPLRSAGALHSVESAVRPIMECAGRAKRRRRFLPARSAPSAHCPRAGPGRRRQQRRGSRTRQTGEPASPAGLRGTGAGGGRRGNQAASDAQHTGAQWLSHARCGKWSRGLDSFRKVS